MDPFKDLNIEELRSRRKEFTDVLDRNGDGVDDKYDSYLDVPIK